MNRALAAPPRTNDPDTPSEAVGSWPSVDLARLGVPPLGWLFVAVGLVVAATHLRSIAGTSLDTLPSAVLSGIASTVVALMPTALLWRAPGATRTHTLLLAGFAAGSIAEFDVGVLSLWSMWPSELAGVLDWLRRGWPLLDAAGSLLVGLGLLRLKGGVTRASLLAASVATFVGLHAVSFELGPGLGVLDAYGLALLVAGPAAAAVVVWVPVAAWLDHAEPRAFWGVLAAALPISLVGRVLELLSSMVRSDALFVPIFTIDAAVSAAIAVLVLVAISRLMPSMARE